MKSLMLVCKYGDEAVPIENFCTSFAELIEKIRSKWTNLRYEQFTLKYLTPTSDKYLLRDDEEFTCMFKMASIFNLKFLDINVYAPYANMDKTLQIVDSNGYCDRRVVDNLSCTNSGVSSEHSIIEQSSNEKPLLSVYWGCGIRHVGQVFRGGRFEFRTILRKYAIARGFDYFYKRNDKTYVSAFCKSKSVTNCPWFVGASLCRFNTSFVVRKFVNSHTCKARLGKEDSKLLSSKVVAELITKPMVGKKKIWDANDVGDYLKQMYGHDISYVTAYHALNKAKTEVFGGEEDSYQQLLWYKRAACDLNPGSKIELELTHDNRFFRIFLAWGACIEGFKFVRPMLFLDGTFLKGKFKGCLLAATGKNANQELYPVAYAVVDAENDSNWLWFLECLSAVVGNERTITFISDRHSGLLAALAEVFPKSPNFFCNRHLKDNLKGKFGGKTYKAKKERMVSLFDRCAYAPSQATLAVSLAEFREEGGETAESFLRGLPLEKWTNAFSGGSRYGEMTSNAIESFNAWITDARGLPITQCIDKLRQKLMEWFVERRTKAAKWDGYLCKKFEDKLEKLIEEGRTWLVKNANNHVFEVFTNKTYTVDFTNWTCTCYQWQLNRFPCSHAVAALRWSNMSMDDFIENYWHVASYRNSYEKSIMPIPTSIRNQYEFPNDVIIKTPITKRPPGRPTTERKKTKGEREDVKAIKCSRCKKVGNHNKTSCKAPIKE